MVTLAVQILGDGDKPISRIFRIKAAMTEQSAMDFVRGLMSINGGSQKIDSEFDDVDSVLMPQSSREIYLREMIQQGDSVETANFRLRQRLSGMREQMCLQQE